MTIQITRSEAPLVGPTMVSTGSAQARRALRDSFERDHYIRLPRLLSNALLGQICRYLDEDAAEFSVRVHEGISTELCLKQGPAPALLLFLTNDAAFFELVRAITGCERISEFTGRLYRMMPGPEHQDSWHDDLEQGRMVAMSINLGTAPFEGGVLEIRERESRRVLHRVANTGPGDAILFRVVRALQHRVTAVEGANPRTAWAGWFESGTESLLLRPQAATGLAGQPEEAAWAK